MTRQLNRLSIVAILIAVLAMLHSSQAQAQPVRSSYQVELVPATIQSGQTIVNQGESYSGMIHPFDDEIIYETDPVVTDGYVVDDPYAGSYDEQQDIYYDESNRGAESYFDQASSTRWMIGTDSQLMMPMLDFQNRQTDKELWLLTSDYQPGIKFGFQARASALIARTNTENSFPYLGRFPTDFVGTAATDARLLHANIGVSASTGRWVHAFGNIQFSDVFSFESFDQGSLQMKEAYVVLGDLRQSPVYGFIGKKAVSFGDMGSLSPFSQAVPWHYFGGLAEGIGVGYSSDRMHVVIQGLDGGRGIRVVDSGSIGEINNFAANLLMGFDVGESYVQLGGGYLHGTIYDANVAEHTDTDLFGTDRNGAWDVNGAVRFRNWVFSGEYVSTLEPWPVTDHRVQAMKAELAYRWMAYNGLENRVSFSWSEGRQGAQNTPFEFNRQYAVGWHRPISPNAFATLEYVRSEGFAPLINITRVSNPDVVQNSIVFGLVLGL